MKPLKYPFTFDEWIKHPSTKPKLLQIKKDFIRLNSKQLRLKL